MKPMIALSIEHYEPLLKGATEASPVGGDVFRIKPVGLKHWVKQVTVVYGDCTGEIRRSRFSSTADHENSGQLLTLRLIATGRLKVTESRPTGGQVRIPVETMHGL
jgi:hypothetical protein